MPIKGEVYMPTKFIPLGGMFVQVTADDGNVKQYPISTSVEPFTAEITLEPERELIDVTYSFRKTEGKQNED